MARVALTAIRRVPKLKECSPESFFKSMMDLSSWGLEPDGYRAHLIPYGKECQLIIDYKGLVELAMRSGKIASIHADVVCDSDTFEVDRGQITRHAIDYKNPRGDVYAVYCLVRFKDGAEKAEVMTREDVEKIRQRSKAGNNGPWKTDWNEMAKKTVFRRCSKWLPLTAEQLDAFQRDFDTIDCVSHRPMTETASDVMERLREPAADMVESNGPSPVEVAIGELEHQVENTEDVDEMMRAYDRLEKMDGVPVAEVKRLGKKINDRAKELGK